MARKIISLLYFRKSFQQEIKKKKKSLNYYIYENREISFQTFYRYNNFWKAP